MELVPESETSYTIPKYNVWLSFVRDATGKITGITGYANGDFEGKKLDDNSTDKDRSLAH